MNEINTIVAVCCYAGDRDLVERAMPVHLAHGCSVVILSPKDSAVEFPGILCHKVGRRAYIGPDSLHRQLQYFKVLLEYPHEYFLLNDADSFCVSAKIPDRLYAECDGVVWSNEVGEPRPHVSPYPKIAMQPPYFLHRSSMEKMLKVGHSLNVHPITPYVDWFMLAMACEAGLKHRPFTDLEHSCSHPFTSTGSEDQHCWQQLDYRIRYLGSAFCHPIKTDWQLKLCREAREFYESTPYLQTR